MNPLGTRGRAQELADLLDSALSGRPAPAGSAALSSYAGIAARLQSLGAGAEQHLAPRAEFRDQLRTRLMAVAAVQAHSAPARDAVERRQSSRSGAVSWTPTKRAQRGIGVAAGAMASVVAVTGIAVAGGQSLPGDPFYGVKKGVEALELSTAGSAVDKGSKHLEFAQERLDEVRALSLGRDAALGAVSAVPGSASAASALGGSTSSHVRQALRDMDDETRAGSELLTQAYRQSNSDVPLQILGRFASGQATALRTLLPDLPAGARARAEVSLGYVSAVAADTSALLAVGVCTGLCQPSAAPPALPPISEQPQPQAQPSASQGSAPDEAAASCTCPPPAAPGSTPEPSAEPTPTASPRPEPTTSAAPTPAPSPTASSSPAPLPVPVPVPSLPVPVPVPLPTATQPPALPAPLPVPTGVPLSGSAAAPVTDHGTTLLALLSGAMPSLVLRPTSALLPAVPTATETSPAPARTSPATRGTAGPTAV